MTESLSVISIPHNWNPRIYQRQLWKFLQNKGRFAVLRWHRRAGKDDVCLHWTAKALMTRVGNYWHMLPEYAQARKAIWNAINPHTGIRRIDEVFPKEIRKRTVDDQMFIEFCNGSTWQVVGSDRFDALVGAPPIGLIFSEYALSNPSAWDYLRPMIVENGGWAIFNSTVRGKNHFWKLGEYSKTDPDWFFQQLDANDSGVFNKEQLDKELKFMVETRGESEGTSIFRQEYMNDPTASVAGAYYGEFMQAAFDGGRITKVPYNPMLPVITAWDIGIGDSTSIWFIQQAGIEWHIIDYYENHNQSTEFYIKYLLKDLPYNYSYHLWPHDGSQREKSTGLTLVETARKMGLRDIKIVSRTATKILAINDVRLMLPRCYFDEVKCEKGINILQSYHKAWDDDKKMFSDKPEHDWSSHGADAFATFAQYFSTKRTPTFERGNTQTKREEYNPLNY